MALHLAPSVTRLRPGPVSRFFVSQRLKLHYVDWGNVGAPPLVLVHGGRDHCRMWDWVAERLSERWHVIAPDLRGHGDSAWSSDGSYSIAGYLYDLAQLVHQLRLAPATIVAHSLGGSISARFAGTFPDQVRQMVLIEGLGIETLFAVVGGSMGGMQALQWAADYPAKVFSVLCIAAAPHHAARPEPERGRHLQLEIRSLPLRLAALRHPPDRRRGDLAQHLVPDAEHLRAGKRGVRPAEGREGPAPEDGPLRHPRRRRTLGAPRPPRRGDAPRRRIPDPAATARFAGAMTMRSADIIRVGGLSASRRAGWLLVGGLVLPCALGRSGRRAIKREGDGATPLGTFRPLRVLFRADREGRPRTSLPVRRLRPDDGWCDAPADANYNRHVRHPYPGSAEEMWRADHLYDLVVVIDHNQRPRMRNGGSAIFLHLAREGFAPTAGCVALRRADMVRLISRLRRRSRICILP